MPEEDFARLAAAARAFVEAVDPAGTSLMAERLRGGTQSVRSLLADYASRVRLRASWRASPGEFDALICPISQTAAFPHDHEPDRGRRNLIVQGRRAALSRPGLVVGRRHPARLAGDGRPRGVNAGRAAHRGPDRRTLARRPDDTGAREADRTRVRRFAPPPAFAGTGGKLEGRRPVELLLCVGLKAARLVTLAKLAREIARQSGGRLLR